MRISARSRRSFGPARPPAETVVVRPHESAQVRIADEEKGETAMVCWDIFGSGGFGDGRAEGEEAPAVFANTVGRNHRIAAGCGSMMQIRPSSSTSIREHSRSIHNPNARGAPANSPNDPETQPDVPPHHSRLLLFAASSRPCECTAPPTARTRRQTLNVMPRCERFETLVSQTACAALVAPAGTSRGTAGSADVRGIGATRADALSAI